jgi:anaerobic ribonucleoside-triphosphate reductase activating protein
MLRWAEMAAPVRTLGPGARVALWVQGCSLACPGCIAPHWQQAGGGSVEPVERVAARVVELSRYEQAKDGLSLSGGEPLQQADAALCLWGLVREALPGFTLVLFTGYRLAEVRKMGGAALSLVQAADLVVEGRYVAALDDGVGLRGSSNQRIVANRGNFEPVATALSRAPRRMELHPRPDGALLAGLPPRSLQAYLSRDEEAP